MRRAREAVDTPSTHICRPSRGDLGWMRHGPAVDPPVAESLGAPTVTAESREAIRPPGWGGLPNVPLVRDRCVLHSEARPCGDRTGAPRECIRAVSRRRADRSIEPEAVQGVCGIGAIPTGQGSVGRPRWFSGARRRSRARHHSGTSTSSGGCGPRHRRRPAGQPLALIGPHETSANSRSFQLPKKNPVSPLSASTNWPLTRATRLRRLSPTLRSPPCLGPR